MPIRVVAGLLACSLLCAREVAAQNNKVEELMSRTANYVAEFVDRFSNVVAEETLVQTTTVPRRTRNIRSDFLLVKFPGDTQWQSFRDVAEVDGKPVRDQQERLTKLFLEPSQNTIRRASELNRESARYNLLNIGSINNPLLVIALLQDNYRERFRFNLSGIEKDLGPRVRTVQFTEFRTPTVIRGDGNRDIPANGLVWIDEETARVVKTELRIGRGASGVRITTLYKFDDDLGVNVPVEMRDWYPDGNAGELRGVATYGRFRRFQVKTEETLK
jgi:hypothetical protein